MTSGMIDLVACSVIVVLGLINISPLLPSMMLSLSVEGLEEHWRRKGFPVSSVLSY